MSVVIRPVRADEWEKLRDLNVKVMVKNKEYHDDAVEGFEFTEAGESFFRSIVTDLDSCCLVAEEEGEWVGYTNGTNKPMPHCKSRYFEIPTFLQTQKLEI